MIAQIQSCLLLFHVEDFLSILSIILYQKCNSVIVETRCVFKRIKISQYILLGADLIDDILVTDHEVPKGQAPRLKILKLKI